MKCPECNAVALTVLKNGRVSEFNDDPDTVRVCWHCGALYGSETALDDVQQLHPELFRMMAVSAAIVTARHIGANN